MNLEPRRIHQKTVHGASLMHPTSAYAPYGLNASARAVRTKSFRMPHLGYRLPLIVPMESENPKNQGALNGPRDHMQARHPDLFSDSVAFKTPKLPKPVFEYHLETLTARKQEYEFETLCRRLAEKEICPNLRPQTGPTGGGDSKVDTETYPVADELSERWWIGDAAAGSERWAFAFSAKKKWKEKIKSDVAKILKTGRDYKRIYFFSNQFVSDKDRAATEDALTAEGGVPVHIVDRSWIVEKVYENGHLALAAEAISIDGFAEAGSVRVGPRDATRTAELKELDSKIVDPANYHGAKYQLVEDCLSAALLARTIERPRSEIEARFAHAASLASDVRYRPQQARIAYARAWTAYWWFEDFEEFSKFYDQTAEFMASTDDAAELERLATLWQLMPPAVSSGRMSEEMAAIYDRRQALEALLKPLSVDAVRMNNALQAETSLAFLEIGSLARSDPSDLNNVWTRLSDVVDKSFGLWAYPIERLERCLRELGQAFDSEDFDNLYEKVAIAMAKRRSDGSAGESYAARGEQKIRRGHPYEALYWLGRAEALLAKEESRRELVGVLLSSARAFDDAGLLWAARSKLIAAAERSLATFKQDGVVPMAALFAVNQLSWIELKLGRITCALEMMSLAALLTTPSGLEGKGLELYKQDVQTQEFALGILMGRVSESQLKEAGQLAATLDRLGLVHAGICLLYALGQYELLASQVELTEGELHEVIASWIGQPIAGDLSAVAEIPLQTCTFKSVVLGLEIRAVVPGDSISVGLTESIFGAVEAFLATSHEAEIAPITDRLDIGLTIDYQTTEFRVDVPEGAYKLDLARPASFAGSSREECEHLRDWMQDIVVAVLGLCFSMRDLDGWAKSKLGEEKALSRAILLGDAWTLANNLLGRRKVLLSDWIENADEKIELLPSKAAASGPKSVEERDFKWGEGGVPDDLIDHSRLKHTQRQVLSLINSRLWDSARWRGTLYARFPSGPPVLGLIFENGQAAAAIFAEWKTKWSNEDIRNELRVSIITGVDATNPAHYWVTVGPNLLASKTADSKVVLTISRVNKMTPSSTTNLEQFLEDYRAVGSYLLVPAWLDDSGAVTFIDAEPVHKRHLDIKAAWEIGENDVDQMVLREEDVPIIPPDKSDSVVMRVREKLLKRKRDRKR